MVLTVFIIMSTVLLKQHSVVDIIGALVMSLVLYPIAYPKANRVPLKDRVTKQRRIHEV